VGALKNVDLPLASAKLTSTEKVSPAFTITYGCEPVGTPEGAATPEYTRLTTIELGPVGAATAELMMSPPAAAARQATSARTRRRLREAVNDIGVGVPSQFTRECPFRLALAGGLVNRPMSRD
jgi:hypothetical protein